MSFCTFNSFAFNKVVYNGCPGLVLALFETLTLDCDVRFDVGKQLEDFIIFQDTCQQTFGTTFDDQFGLDCDLVFTVYKNLSETITNVDDLIFYVGKQLEEFIEIACHVGVPIIENFDEAMGIEDDGLTFFVFKVLDDLLNVDCEFSASFLQVVVDIIRDYFTLDLNDDNSRQYFALRFATLFFD